MRIHGRRILVGAGVAAAVLAVLPVSVSAQTVRTDKEFTQYNIPANDDGSSALVPLGFTINFFGKTRSSVYVNNNGNVTFDAALPTYTPFGLTGTQREIIAPFFADIDTRPKGSKLTTYGRTKINNHLAFGVNYVDVGYYNVHMDKTNSFQVVLTDRSDTGAGNFDIEFNYDRILWETGDASGGVNGYGGVSASVGWSNGSGDPGTSWQMDGSMIPGSFLDSGPKGLVNSRYNSTTTGRYQFRARDGVLIPALTIQSFCPVPNATAGSHYQYAMTATGEKEPYSWAMLPDPGFTLPVTLTSYGVLSGDPKDVGTYNFTVQVTAKTDDGDVTVARRCSLTVDPPQLTIRSVCPLPDAVVGAAYSQNLSAIGGSAPYTWTGLSGSVPGLILNSNGTLAGTPTAAGTYPFTLQVVSNDPGVRPATRSCSVVVRSATPTPTISACPTSSATVGVPYTETLGASGGGAPYTWTLYGQLPSGLSMNDAGVIGGIPDAVGDYTFRIEAADSRRQPAARDCTVSVRTPALTLGPACPLPAGSVGLPYSQQLNAVGGSGPYGWSVSGGMLPEGLRLSSDGVISGTPSVAGAKNFRLVATDAQGLSAGTGCSMVVARPAFSIASCPLPPGTAGNAYDAGLTAIGGVEPYFWTVDGSLPAGLGVSTYGRITGTPASGGSYSFTLRAADSRGQTVTQLCGVTIDPPLPTVSSACPLPGAEVGKAYSLALAAQGGTPPYRWLASGDLPVGIVLSSDGTLTGVASKQGSYSFTLLGSDAKNRAMAKQCSLAVNLPAMPAISVSDLPAVVAPATSNIAGGVELSDVYGLPVQGTAMLSIVPATGSGAGLDQADPLVRFANNQVTIPFTIPVGTRKVALPIVSSGTVAGAVTFSVKSLDVSGNKLNYVPSAKAFSVATAAPVMTAACYASSGSGIALTVTGYSTTRQVDSAEVTVDGKTLTQNTKPASIDYYSNDLSIRTGGAFTLALPAVGTSASPGSVAVVLVNSAGRSASRTAARCQ